MFGDYCCTFIPNNTAPDGSITKAIAGLTSLSHELSENSGVEDIFGGWFDHYFGKYKELDMSFLVAIGSFLGILICCGCCCIPCMRTLINRLITTAIAKEKDTPLCQMPLLEKYDNMNADDEKESSSITFSCKSGDDGDPEEIDDFVCSIYECELRFQLGLPG